MKKKYKATNFNKALRLARTTTNNNNNNNGSGGGVATVGSDVFDGMRFEACRAILNAFNGDILRMAYNTLQEREVEIPSRGQ